MKVINMINIEDETENGYSVIQNLEKEIIAENPEGEKFLVVVKKVKLHIVKPLETMDDICKKHNIKKEELMQINNLQTQRVFVGQALNLLK